MESEQLGHPFAGNLSPFERLRYPFIGYINPFTNAINPTQEKISQTKLAVIKISVRYHYIQMFPMNVK